MTVKVRFLCRELVGDIQNGEYTFPEDTTVEKALGILSQGGGFVENYEKFVLCMVNSRPSRPDMLLHDGDMLMVLRKVMGG